MAGWGRQPVLPQRRTEFLGGGDEVVRLHLGETNLRDLPDGPRKILLDGVPQGVELERVGHRVSWFLGVVPGAELYPVSGGSAPRHNSSATATLGWLLLRVKQKLRA